MRPRPSQIQHFPSQRRARTPPRWVRVDDAELLRRVQRVRTDEALQRSLSPCDLASGSWKWEVNKKNFSVYSRRGRRVGAPRAEVFATGTIQNTTVERLAAFIRSGNETDFNNSMKALYKGEFIYGSLVHIVACGDINQPTHRTENACEQCDQVTVKTCAFVRHARISLDNNEQWCFVEQFRRTPHGFAIEFSSLDTSEISLGKARPGCIDELQPIIGRISVEQTSPSLPVRLVFQARLDDRATVTHLTQKLCSVKTTLGRMVQLAKGMSRLGNFVRDRPGVNPHHHSNSHCISCTTHLKLAYRLAGRTRQCQLCFFSACHNCCQREQLVIYNRYTAALEVCHRCKESMQGGEYSHLQLLEIKQLGDSFGSRSLWQSEMTSVGALSM